MMPEAFRSDRSESWNRPFSARTQRTTGLALSAAEREAIAKSGKAKKPAPKPAAAKSAPAATKGPVGPTAKASIPTKSIAKR
jgi:hypothetical protein